MINYDIVIIGGGPGGVTTALSARNTYTDKRILLIRREKTPMIPCGIPYVLHSLESIEQNILPDAPLKKNGIDVMIDEVVSIGDHSLTTGQGTVIGWDKLVLATGSVPAVPPIPGVDKRGVFPVSKDAAEISALRSAVDEGSEVVVIGGGFIGIEVSDELLRAGMEVHLVEREQALLPSTMDPEFGQEVEALLKARGARVLTGTSVDELLGDERVTGVRLGDGTEVPADLVIVSVGYAPETKVAQEAGLDVDPRYGIVVDEYMRTSRRDVFAVGDCAAKRHFLMGDYSPIMLASTAMAQGRLVGSNLFDIKVVKGFGGVIGTFSTKIGDTAFAATGLTEAQANALGIEYVVGVNESVDRHPGRLPGAARQKVKLLYSRHSHVLLGAQLRGGDSVGELVNMLALMVQNHMTDMETNTIQIGTHPLLTASPIAYPVINATVDAILKWFASSR